MTKDEILDIMRDELSNWFVSTGESAIISTSMGMKRVKKLICHDGGHVYEGSDYGHELKKGDPVEYKEIEQDPHWSLAYYVEPVVQKYTETSQIIEHKISHLRGDYEESMLSIAEVVRPLQGFVKLDEAEE